MRFGLTRDSALWLVTAVGSIVTFLTPLPPPWEWSYAQWLQAIGAAGLGLSGWLATSPRPHSEEGNAKITPSGR